jgi:hypothetical protein
MRGEGRLRSCRVWERGGGQDASSTSFFVTFQRSQACSRTRNWPTVLDHGLLVSLIQTPAGTVVSRCGAWRQEVAIRRRLSCYFSIMAELLLEEGDLGRFHRPRSRWRGSWRSSRMSRGGRDQGRQRDSSELVEPCSRRRKVSSTFTPLSLSGRHGHHRDYQDSQDSPNQPITSSGTLHLSCASNPLSLTL